ncbi:Aste57867_10053 [Aphanomyces stellatus]|uniref:Aste57867_10053 protein n=1 Tax=Aphanomyces stellatus TaxID=120398 RepID=A0A485KPU6_9STRA|nr:hypothetical protein As57867_010014 [Aphanomyces stellatus]VFT86929.1 Aste57867_10053 [Aphanomyces stellatus]
MHVPTLDLKIDHTHLALSISHPIMVVPTYTIRPACRADADAIAEMHMQSWREAFSHMLPADYIDTVNSRRHASYRAQLAQSNPSNERILIVAVHDQPSATDPTTTDEVVAGICAVGKSRATSDALAPFSYELHCVYVLAAFHGGGVAQALLRAAMTTFGMTATDSMFCKVFLKNVRAMRFYSKLGAHEVEREETTEYSVDPEFIVAMGWDSVHTLLG